MTTVLNCTLLGLSVIGAFRVAYRDRSEGWALITLALVVLFAHHVGDIRELPQLAEASSFMSSGLLLAGLLELYYSHRDQVSEMKTRNAIQEAAMRREVNETIQRLDRAQRELGRHD